jgi:uncharacterized cupredoxin-like copper-binding protein
MSTITRRHLLATSLVTGSGFAIALSARTSRQGTLALLASPAASPMASPAASPMASPAAGGSSVTLNAIDINWDPKELSFPADTDIVVTVTNTGILQHDFVIDELSIHSDLLNGGESVDVKINAPAGTYTFYCSVPGHKEAGMVGTLTVG